MSIYSLHVETEDGPAVASAYGDLDAMAYHVRRLKTALDDGNRYSAHLAEVTEIGGDDKRTVASVTGDPEVVLFLLGKRLRHERAASEPATAEA